MPNPSIDDVLREIEEIERTEHAEARQLQALQRSVDKRLTEDTFPGLLAVAFLGLAIVTVVALAAAISLSGGAVPDALIAIGAASVGGLAGLISVQPRQRQKPAAADAPTDRFMNRLAVALLGATALAVVSGSFVLSLTGENAGNMPDALIAIGAASVGGLAGLLNLHRT